MNLPNQLKQPPIRAVHMGLYPTMGSLQDVLDYADAQLPITSKNELVSILCLYHNTLLQTLQAPQ